MPFISDPLRLARSLASALQPLLLGYNNSTTSSEKRLDVDHLEHWRYSGYGRRSHYRN